MANHAIDYRQRASELVRDDESFANALRLAAGERRARRMLAEVESAAIAFASKMKRRKDPDATLAAEVRRLKRAAVERCK
jgi:hypothetical protein